MGYKVESIEKEIVIDEYMGSVTKIKEKRYIIVDEDTGKVLDDAQGYGYKSAEKAYRGYAYKNRTPDKKKRDKELKDWLKKQKGFLKRIEDEMWYAFKDGDEFTVKDVENVMKEFDDVINSSYTAKEIFYVVRKL